jgi:hypothetical protein
MNTSRHTNLMRERIPGRAVVGAPPHGCHDIAARSNQLKRRLTTRLAFEAGENMPQHVVKQAATDAEALAWSTPYPLLFLPALLEEKLAGARLWLGHQQEILERQKALAEAV